MTKVKAYFVRRYTFEMKSLNRSVDFHMGPEDKVVDVKWLANGSVQVTILSMDYQEDGY